MMYVAEEGVYLRIKLFLRKTVSLIIRLDHTLACIITASNGHILKVYIHIDKKPFAKNKLPTALCTTLFPEIFTSNILDYKS